MDDYYAADETGPITPTPEQAKQLEEIIKKLKESAEQVQAVDLIQLSGGLFKINKRREAGPNRCY